MHRFEVVDTLENICNISPIDDSSLNEIALSLRISIMGMPLFVRALAACFPDLDHYIEFKVVNLYCLNRCIQCIYVLA